jgi:hypothetical protein
MGRFTNARTNEREDKRASPERTKEREGGSERAQESTRERADKRPTVSSDHMKRRVVLAIALHNHKYGMCFRVGNINIALTIDGHSNGRHEGRQERTAPRAGAPRAGALVRPPLAASYRAISSSGKYRPFVTSGRQAENSPSGIGHNYPTLQVNGDATR